MEEMTSRERLLALFKGERIDRIPWSPLVDYYYLGDRDLVDTAIELGFDCMERHVPGFAHPFGASIDVSYDAPVKESSYEDERFIIKTYETPAGELKEVKEKTPLLKYGSITKYLLSNREDLKKYRYLLESMVLGSLKEEFMERDREIGENGLAVPSAPMTPIQQFLQSLMGLEKTIYMLYDHPEEMEEILYLLHEKNQEIYRLLLGYPSPLFIAYEDTSTTVLSPDLYREWSMPFIDTYAHLLHERGRIYLTHMCGQLKALTPLLALGRMDGIDSLCPPTTGDLSVDEARDLLGGEKILVGGIEPPALLRMGPDEVEEYVLTIFKRIAPGKNFILSTGDALPHGTREENLIRIKEVVREYGSYPLTCSSCG